MAEERRSGTLEMLITLPVRDHQVILGKFLGTWAVVLLGVLGTLLFPLMMFGWPWKLGPLDWGPLWAGYLGILLSSAATVAIGMLISSLTESQVIAFFVTFAVTLVLHLSGAFVDSIEYPPLRLIVAFISFDAKIATLARGLVTTRDVLYFLSIAVMCLMASFHALERRKWA
jgi:ABC-2 type transport system permease protein